MRRIFPLSSKQLNSFQESNAKINIWEGAVRSGKTYVSLVRWLDEIVNGPKGEYCMISRTYDTFRRNILTLLTQIIGTDAKYFSGLREMEIYGKKIFIVGADDERAEAKIRGATFKGAYVDEATLIPESVFRMLISRCAMGNARIFATTNPDSPYHWLKKDFIDDNNDCLTWQFTLDDNPELSENEKEYLKRQYKGIWYHRFIEGRWVQAEGAVYDFFDEKIHTLETVPEYAESYIVGVDYGTTNPCAFILLGINRSKFPNIWVEDEYYYDSKVHQRQKTDSEYAEDLKRFIAGKNVRSIYVDPSAASFKLELHRQGVQGLQDAQNEVLDGIRFVSDLLNNGTLKISRKAKNLIQEFQSYVWDAKAAQRGEDKPLKTSDHCVTGDTLVWANGKLQQIKDIESSGFILSYDEDQTCYIPYEQARKTQNNAHIYELELENGQKIKATDNHKILTQNGWKELKHLTLCDIVMTCNTNTFKISSSIKTNAQDTGLHQNVQKSACMLLFMNSIMAKFQKVFTSITKMVIKAITP